MTRRHPHRRTYVRGVVGAALLALLVLSPLRGRLESGMALQMLVQDPALMVSGAWLASALPSQVRSRLMAWNQFGFAGLACVALCLTLLMIPRVLDLAITDPRVEVVKIAALLSTGAVLLPSWRAAGLVVQAFFLGNLLPMMFVVATLYQDSPARLCNAYRLDDQQQLGRALWWISAAIAAAWLLPMAYRFASADRPEGTPGSRTFE